jgi:hypothetical protein
MTTYKYASAHEWLRQHLQSIEDAELLRQLAYQFARKMDGDDIQELFEKEMDADEFFKAVTE